MEIKSIIFINPEDPEASTLKNRNKSETCLSPDNSERFLRKTDKSSLDEFDSKVPRIKKKKSKHTLKLYKLSEITFKINSIKSSLLNHYNFL